MVGVAVMVEVMRSVEHGAVSSARVLDVHIRIRLPNSAVLRTEIVVLMSITMTAEFEIVSIDIESRCVRVISAGAELRDNQTVVYSPHTDHVPADVPRPVERLPPYTARGRQLRGGRRVAGKGVRVYTTLDNICPVDDH